MSLESLVPIAIAVVTNVLTAGAILGAHRQVVSDLRSKVRRLEESKLDTVQYIREYDQVRKSIEDVDERRETGDQGLERRVGVVEGRLFRGSR